MWITVQLMTSLNGGSIAVQEVVGMASLGRLKILVDRYPSARRSRRTTISSTGVWSVERCSCPQHCTLVMTAQPRRHMLR